MLFVKKPPSTTILFPYFYLLPFTPLFFTYIIPTLNSQLVKITCNNICMERKPTIINYVVSLKLFYVITQFFVTTLFCLLLYPFLSFCFDLYKHFFFVTDCVINQPCFLFLFLFFFLSLPFRRKKKKPTIYNS